ncbi:hypothetical protein HPB47_017827, partial [Ixodes persulcatus]
MNSPMDYQQAYKPHGFKTWLSATIAPGRGAACPVPELRLFDDTSEHTFSDIFSPEEQRILMPSGLVVNPSCPWLGASPDRFLYDPEERSYGTLVIKCPYSLKDSEPSVASSSDFFLTINNDEPHLDRDSEHYCQVLGQMALTECQWADFVVWSENWIAVERIHFDKTEWARVK